MMDSAAYLPFQNPPKPEYFTALQRIGSDFSPERQTQMDFHSEASSAVHRDHELCDRNDSEENVTFISESMTVTSSDEEKLLLLNKNTELRRLNKELMKLNQEWDQIYRNTTTGLQQTVGCLQQEVVALKQHTERLSMKLDHEQTTELLRKPNESEEIVDIQLPPPRISYNECPVDVWETAGQKARGSETAKHRNSKLPSQQSKALQLDSRRTGKEVTELKEQLQAMKCQTEIFEADYQTEHKDRQRIKAENEKLRKKEGDMRQQMLLLQEQLKIYEDDFRKERSDKQVLQRLLKGKASPKDPVLLHRCNNESHETSAVTPAVTSNSVPRRSSSKQCERHSQKHSECSKHHHLRDVELQASPFPIDYK